MKFLMLFSSLAALSFLGATYAPSAPPPIHIEYHYLTDSVGITWYDADYDRLLRWVHWRNTYATPLSLPTDLQYRPVPIVPQAQSPTPNPPRNRNRRRYGPGPDDWEYDSLP